MTTTTAPVRPAPGLDHRTALRQAETAYRRFAELAAEVPPAGLGAPHRLRAVDRARPRRPRGRGHARGRLPARAAEPAAEISARAEAEGLDETAMMTRVQVERTAALDAAALVAECHALVGPAARGRGRLPRLVRSRATIAVHMDDLHERWTLGYLLDVVLTRDAWLHRVDLARALGREPAVTPEHDGAVVADVVADWQRRHGRPVDLTLTGPAGGHWRVAEPAEAAELPPTSQAAYPRSSRWTPWSSAARCRAVCRVGDCWRCPSRSEARAGPSPGTSTLLA